MSVRRARPLVTPNASCARSARIYIYIYITIYVPLPAGPVDRRRFVSTRCRRITTIRNLSSYGGTAADVWTTVNKLNRIRSDDCYCDYFVFIISTATGNASVRGGHELWVINEFRNARCSAEPGKWTANCFRLPYAHRRRDCYYQKSPRECSVIGFCAVIDGPIIIRDRRRPSVRYSDRKNDATITPVVWNEVPRY